MEIIVQNTNLPLSMALSIMKLLGYWAPRHFRGTKKFIINFYIFFSFNFLVGIYVITQTIELFQVWGDISLMTSAAFLLFTNIVLGLKLLNVLIRRETVEAMIDESDAVLRAEDRDEGKYILNSINRETTMLLFSFVFLSAVTVIGWGISAEKRQLPLQAWYPYDKYKSPAFELTYAYQVVAVNLSAAVNVSMDTLVTSCIAQCRCRLKILGLSLKTLCQNAIHTGQWVLTPDQEKIVASRLRRCIAEHQAILSTVVKIQETFSEPLFAQFTVSIFIICVTAYQLVFETKSTLRLIAMLAYLLVMMLQVFLFCYQGNELSEESTNVANAVYTCPWYACSAKLRRLLLLPMTRSVRVARITAGGITTLSLAAFMAIIKASYTFFTVLQQMGDRT
uniref:Odorant receptor n=1 Tax=Galleria mellonella TaxID=7137 RepID=A0A5C0E403_GALME|nr:odorant receptor 16 [Galleria mellonella]